MTTMINYLQLLFSQPRLVQQDAEAAMECMLAEADPHQIAAFLTVLKYRGETPEEVAGMVQAMTRVATQVRFPYPVIDIVGTGGDMANTVNISTGAAILTAACGIPVAKHGNRSVSSRSGSADVLEALGIDIEIPKERLGECLKKTNIVFMYAPAYHSCLKKIAPIRRGLKLPTVFNLLGPLLNPANAEYALIGVPNEKILELLSQVILRLGTTKRTLIFHGNGVDELTPIGPICGYDIRDGQRHKINIDPQSLGFSRCSLKDLEGGEAADNAKLLTDAFNGKEGALADTLAFTAGAAVWLFNRTHTLKEGVETAKAALRGKKAIDVLDKWKEFSKEVAR